MRSPVRNDPLASQIRDRDPSFFITGIQELIRAGKRGGMDGIGV